MTLPRKLIGMHLKFLSTLYVLYSVANFKHINGKNGTIWLKLTPRFFLWCINHIFFCISVRSLYIKPLSPVKVNLLQGIWQIDNTIIPSLQLIFTHRLQQLVASGYPTCNSVRGFSCIKHQLSMPFFFTKLKILGIFLQTLVFKSLWSRTAPLYLWLSVNTLMALWLMRKAWKCHYSQLRAQKINSNNPKAIGFKLVELYLNNYKIN